ncbi:alpha/beta hydrolase [Niabella aurantiaca]|uniref:alpha/beta hydrolase n=1 Tax=Niabella aurantiaca TaxID=379900 RepID=UPI00037E247B|nr:alpha/beta hydrolase-fold protein [Niabella aurantiaca]
MIQTMFTKMTKFFAVAAFLLLHLNLLASTADTLEVYSAKMKKNIKTVVILPDGYAKTKKYPVVYLLHGYSGSYAYWPAVKGAVDGADRYQMILVCPDGGYGSWYWDSPVDPAFQYETFVAKELVAWVDKHYATIAAAKGRGIAGLSMGGHGALYLAIKHPDVFGATGSMSGGVDIRPFPNNWDMAKRLGKYSEFPERWEKNTVINMLHLIEPKTLKIIIDCGTEDFFYKVNEKLHQELLLRNIPHDYITRPGGHTSAYWQNAIYYQLLFMDRFFSASDAGAK